METGLSSVKAVESEEEFNTLLPQLVVAMNSNKEEWEFYHNLGDLLETMNGNRHMLFYGGDIYNVKVFAFFQVSAFPTMNSQVELIWSWAKDELCTDLIADAAVSVALASRATRLRANSCRHLAKKLIKQGFHARSIDMIKEV